MNLFVDDNLRTTVVELAPEFTRSIPDPNFGKVFYVFLVRCKNLPDGISDAPNARSQNLNKKIYKEVRASLLENDDTPEGTFHLKNSGITIVSKFVDRLGHNRFAIHLEEDLHGIVDGGHTYNLICENRDKIPADQFVLVKAFYAIDNDWIPMISKGLNTSVQVKDMSLDNLAGKFNWLKEALGEKRDLVSWSENTVSSKTEMDARELVSILCLFNVILYPNTSGTHPIDSYNAKAKILSLYEKKLKEFMALSEIVLEIMDLYEYVSSTSNKLWDKKQNARSKNMRIFDPQKQEFTPPFSIKKYKSDHRLSKPVLYPLLNAFRRFVTVGESKNIEWIVDYEEVKYFWKTEGRDLLEVCQSTVVEFRHKLNLVGKNSTLWSTLHDKVGLRLYESGVLKSPAAKPELRQQKRRVA